MSDILVTKIFSFRASPEDIPVVSLSMMTQSSVLLGTLHLGVHFGYFVWERSGVFYPEWFLVSYPLR